MRIPELAPFRNDDLVATLSAAIDNKTKPLGSLGRLEALASQLGLIQSSATPRIDRPAILVFAADHGIVAEGVSAYPQEVTWQMVENFLAGGAAINVFARQNHCAIQVIDAGVNHDFGARDGLVDRKVARGTRNFALEPAMGGEECALAMERGMALARDLPGNGVGFGEMGIGNTTAAAALMHKLAGIPLPECVGAGTGLSPEGVRRKQAVRQAAVDYCVFAHCSNEQGHRLMLDHLGARPLLQLDLRLGEGTGSALALPLLHAAANFLAEMATFSSAQVSTGAE